MISPQWSGLFQLHAAHADAESAGAAVGLDRKAGIRGQQVVDMSANTAVRLVELRVFEAGK